MSDENYTILHLHSMDSNPKSGLQVDSVTHFSEYIPRIKECGMNAVAFTEHGSVLNNVAKKQLCDKNGIKYIHAEEFYVTESIDREKLVRDNYHCLLFAKNKSGVEELNELSSIASQKDGHEYYQPRISLEELEHTSDNILILTACVAGILSRGTKTAKERFLKFIIANKNRCWLEIQPHDFDLQKQYNKYLFQISKQYDLRLIATSDIHALNETQLMGRAIMQKAKLKGNGFHDEDECDLSFKDYNGMVAAFRKQGVLPESVYLDALEETNRFADEIESYDLDYSNKYPRSYKDPKTELKNRIKKGIKERGVDKLPNYKTEYIPRINEEYKTYVHNDAVDFILLDSDYKIWMKEHGMAYGPSRGSVSGSEIAYLIHCTDMDSIKFNLNFSRFMNPERVSLADVDTDIYADDRYAVREYFFNRKDMYCCNIVTFNTIKMRGAIKDVARALEYTPEEAQSISNLVYTDDNGEDAIPDEVRDKYPELFEYVDIVTGTITSLGRHAAGIVISPTCVSKDFGTVYIDSDPRPVSQIDMHEIDSLNYVKLDLLGLNAVGLIDKACKLAKIPFRTPDNTDMDDEKVIQSIAEDTTLIFQFESGFASDCLKRILSADVITKIRNYNPNISYMDLMSICNGVIRPAGESFREQLLSGEIRDNGNKVLNDFLASTMGFLNYQEQIIEFLNKFCGFTMGQADVVRRCIDEDSLITMGNGNLKKIKDIEPGERVISYTDIGNSVVNTINNVFDNGVQDCISISVKHGYELTCTKTHKILTQNGFVPAGCLNESDYIMIPSEISYIPVKITSIKDAGKRHVYDLEVDNNHNYIANNMIVHNCFAKKTGTKDVIPIIKDGGYMVDVKGNKDDRYIKGFVQTAIDDYGSTKEEAEQTITYFLQVISDASNYLFSKNHSDAYSAIGYFIGWLRYYYPLQLLTAALNVYKSNDKKMNEIKTYIRSKGIEINPIKFRKSRADYFMDVDENAIYQDIESIKDLNAKGAEELYELGKNEYSSFIELLADIKEHCCLNKSQLDILIKLDYFSEFGDINNILRQVEIFEAFYKRKQFNKDEFLSYGVSEDQLKKYVGNETAKLYRDVDVVGLMSELANTVNEPKTTTRQKMLYEINLLGYIVSKDPSAPKNEFYVGDVTSNKAVTTAVLYEMYSGKQRSVKMWNNVWGVNPFVKCDIIKITRLKKQAQKEATGEIDKNGKKVRRDIPGKYEYWLQEYQIL